MSEKNGQRPAWAYTLSGAVVFFAISTVATTFDGGLVSEPTMALTVIAWILGAGGAVQFLMSRRE
ncbi:hypothetical protein ACF07D_07450 [Leucobacter sp. NPDC015123]|uniref:hypothetical protein n=1 Tax=Leucobacter sp. NPDC015123 TaxID=3364129 RepID=UPI0036F49CF6